MTKDDTTCPNGSASPSAGSLQETVPLRHTPSARAPETSKSHVPTEGSCKAENPERGVVRDVLEESRWAHDGAVVRSSPRAIPSRGTRGETTRETNESQFLRPAWVLLPEEARARGFKNALAFKRWCRRHRVAIRRDGRMLWVRPEDVDIAVGVLPIQSLTPAVAATVEAIKSRRR